MNPNELADLEKLSNEIKQPLVLVIEECAAEQKLFSMIQNRVGMVSCIVGDCGEGLEAAASLDFKLIILDLKMPNADGVICAGKIRDLESARGVKTPIIAVTANAMPGDREKCIEAGADDYLAKPFSVSELRQKISEWAA